jgi:hypothetical protein
MAAGFLDKVLPPDQVLEGTVAEASALAELPVENYAGNKREIRGPFIATIEASIG